MALAGDHEMLTRLVSEHLPAALQFAVRLTGRVEVAEEIVQESLLRAVRSLHTFAGRSQFRTWLFRIVIHAFRDHLAARQRRSTADLPEALPDPRALDPFENAATAELGELIAARVSALPPRQREVLVLAAYEQMRPADVAEVLGISTANVHVNLHLARTRLQAELAPYLAEK